MERITIPVLLKSVSGQIETQQKYKVWEISDPEPRDIIEDDLWYLDQSICEETEVRWPVELIGHYHEAEGSNTRMFHANYDISYIVPLSVSEFEQLINQ